MACTLGHAAVARKLLELFAPLCPPDLQGKPTRPRCFPLSPSCFTLVVSVCLTPWSPSSTTASSAMPKILRACFLASGAPGPCTLGYPAELCGTWWRDSAFLWQASYGRPSAFLVLSVCLPCTCHICCNKVLGSQRPMFFVACVRCSHFSGLCALHFIAGFL